MWVLLLNWTDKTKFWIWNNESRSSAWFMVVLSWNFCCSWKLRIEIYLFDSNFEVLTNKRSFSHVFVDCVVLGRLKPTKLCRMIKIMLQIAITLFLDDANVDFVSWYGSIFTRFQNYCTNVREILHKCWFLLLIWTDKTKFWIWNNESRWFAWFMVVLSWKFCCSWKLRIEI